MDFEKTVVAGFIFLLLGGSFLAAIWVVDTTMLPVAAIIYLLIGLALLRRIKQAKKVG